MGYNEIRMKRIVYIFSLISLVACDQGFQGNLKDKIHQTCSSSEHCKINLGDVTDFEWDNMYVFALGTTHDTINKVIGVNYIYWEDMSASLIFTKANTISYFENYVCNDPESQTTQLINFEIPRDTVNFKSYFAVSRKEAVFDVKMIEGKKNTYYLLSLSK